MIPAPPMSTLRSAMDFLRSRETSKMKVMRLKMVTCFFPFPPFLKPQKFRFFFPLRFVAEKSRNVPSLHESNPDPDESRFVDPVYKLGWIKHLNQTALRPTFTLPHERSLTSLGSIKIRL